MAITIQGGERPTELANTLFSQVFGVEGTGKTSFALSHPSPLYIVNFDRPMDRLLEKLPAHYEIHYEEVQHDVDISRSTAASVMLKVKSLYEEAFRGKRGTFIIDGADLYWEQVKVAKLPDDADLPNQWGPANQAMESLYRRAANSGIQCVFTSIASNVWSGMKNETNRMKADGFKHTGRFINSKIYFFSPEDHNQPDLVPAEALVKTHSAYISQSKLNESIIGSVVPNLSFKMLYRLVFGEAYPEADQLWVPG